MGNGRRDDGIGRLIWLARRVDRSGTGNQSIHKRGFRRRHGNLVLEESDEASDAGEIKQTMQRNVGESVRGIEEEHQVCRRRKKRWKGRERELRQRRRRRRLARRRRLCETSSRRR